MQRCCYWICALFVALLVLGCGGNGGSHPPTGTNWTIGPTGGTFQTTSNEVKLTVPAGAVASKSSVSWSAVSTAPTPPAGTTYVAGSAYTFSHVTFSTPATLAMTFSDSTPTADLKIYRKADGSDTWTPLTTTVDVGTRTATAQIDSFSSYGLFYKTPLALSAHWVEWRKNLDTNKMFMDVYTAPAGGTETLAYSPAQEQGSTQLRYATFRWADKTFLGLDFATPDTYIASFNIETSVSTRLGKLPVEDGKYIVSMEMARANNVAGANYVAAQYTQRNQNTGENRDSLVLFSPGSIDPTVLVTFTRTDNQSPFVMRPLDVNAEGKVLALRDNGLVILSASGSQSVLIGAAQNPQEAYFSPSGSMVLFRGNGGWQLVNPTTFAVTTVAGQVTGDRVRWANDDQHIVSATSAGDNRRIELINVSTGDTQLITIGGDHPSSHINDVGVHN